MNSQPRSDDTGAWFALQIPQTLEPPMPLSLRIQSIPPRHYFPEHAHPWSQFVYAVLGVLTITVEGRCFVIPANHAVWVPTGVPHSVGSLHGSEYRSLYITEEPSRCVAETCTAFEVPPLLRALILEAATPNLSVDEGYAGRVTRLILDQLYRLHPVRFSLPWPQDGALYTICHALYANPGDTRDIDAWGRLLGVSSRTLSRRFERELGMSLRNWRRQLRLLKAVELLDGGANVTETAFSLGYSSPSAFVYMFRTEMGCSPKTHRQRAVLNRV